MLEITLYEDCTISENLFDWQSYHKDTENSKNDQIYVKCTYISYQGNNPVSFVWTLNNNMPDKFISKANKNGL